MTFIPKEIELTPEDFRYGPGRVSYSDINKTFGTVLVEIDQDDYQGSSIVAIHNEELGFGFVIYGWGSCSGCDALQDCHNAGDLRDLQMEIFNDFSWFPTLQDMQEHVRLKDWNGTFCAYERDLNGVSLSVAFMNAVAQLKDVTP